MKRSALDRLPPEGHMQDMLIQTETTPNPATLKFLPGQTVMESGTRDFASPGGCRSFAARRGDLLDRRRRPESFSAATSSRSPPRRASSGRTSSRRCSDVLLDHFSSGAPLFRAASAGGIAVAPDEDYGDDPADAEIVAQIRELIETRVRPAVAQDGGDIVYRGFRGGTVYLALHGACSGCPSSTMTLKQGIESLLKHYVPEVET